jgi:hypothetical protein
LTTRLVEHKMCVWFSLQLLCQTILILRRTERDTIKKVYRSSCKVPVMLAWFNLLRIFSTAFRKILKYKISWNPLSGNRVVPCGRTDGRTDRRDEANSHFSKFRQRA